MSLCRLSRRVAASGNSLGRFVAVAKATCQPEIFFVVGAASGAGYDVFDFQSTEDDFLRAATIAATVIGRGSDAGAHGFRDVCVAHGSNGSRKPRRTASRNACALRNQPCW